MVEVLSNPGGARVTLRYSPAMTQVPGIEFDAVATIRDHLYDRIPMAAEELALIDEITQPVDD